MSIFSALMKPPRAAPEPAPAPAPTPAAVSPREAALREMLRLNPGDHVARVKLLELYFQQGQEQDFLREATLFREGHKGNLDTPDWKAVQSIGLRMFPDSPMFAEPIGMAQRRRIGEDAKAQPLFQELARMTERVCKDPRFIADFDRELLFTARRPTPLVHARRLSDHLGGAQIYLKREDVAPPGTHLHTCILGQAMLAQRLGKLRLVAGTVRGQRGVLLSEVAARLGLKAVVYMDQEQVAREATNVFRMWLSSADVRSVDVSELRSSDVREAALQQWLADPQETMLIMGTDHGPEPYPTLAREFSASIGRECRRQMLALARTTPDLVVARGGDSPDGIGMFQPFIGDGRVRLACIEGRHELPSIVPGAKRVDALSMQQRRLSDAILDNHEFPSVRREHAWLRGTGRVCYQTIESEAAREAIQLLAHREGLIPAIDTAHALAWAIREARAMTPQQSVVVVIGESADKDLVKIGRSMGVPL